MTTYTAIPDGDIDPESPLTTGLITLLRDNPLSIAQGNASAPIVSARAGGGLVLLEEQIAAASSEIIFNDVITAAFDVYRVLITELIGSTTYGMTLRFSTDNGASFISTGDYDWIAVSAGGTTANGLNQGAIRVDGLLFTSTVTTGQSAYTDLNVYGMGNSALFTKIGGRHGGSLSAPSNEANITGAFTQQNVVNAMRFAPTAGTFTSGNFRLYGIRAV